MTLLQRSAAQSAANERSAYTLLDVVVTMAIIGLLTAISAPRASAFLDSIAVQGASSDAFAIFSSARNAAVNGAAQATVEIDTLRVTMTARQKTDTILQRELGRVHD
ncbi:MAG: type II secretion system protein, partial [Gemmatimonadaceae bacterium]|nr:type II secretion system protein [Gemmatimonadaceae bacterium]